MERELPRSVVTPAIFSPADARRDLSKTGCSNRTPWRFNRKQLVSRCASALCRFARLAWPIELWEDFLRLPVRPGHTALSGFPRLS